MTIIEQKKEKVKAYLHSIHKLNKDTSLMQINICASRICGRHCMFCPQSNKKKNEEILKTKPQFLDYRVISRIAIEGYRKDFKGVFVFNGMGEPTENPQLPYMCQIIRMYCPSAKIQIITNGDNEDVIREIHKKTKDVLFVFSEYTVEDTKRNRKIYSYLTHKEFRKFYTLENIGLLNNRSMNINIGDDTVPNECCHKPFFTTSIDTDGSLLICNNDWYGENPYGLIDVNENNSKLWSQWKERLEDLRMIMLLNERPTCEYPCSLCNDNKHTYAKSFVNFWKKKYIKNYIIEKFHKFFNIDKK